MRRLAPLEALGILIAASDLTYRAGDLHEAEWDAAIAASVERGLVSVTSWEDDEAYHEHYALTQLGEIALRFLPALAT